MEEAKSMPDGKTAHSVCRPPLMRRGLIALALLALIGWPLSAASQTLTVYSGRGEKFTKPVL